MGEFEGLELRRHQSSTYSRVTYWEQLVRNFHQAANMLGAPLANRAMRLRLYKAKSPSTTPFCPPSIWRNLGSVVPLPWVTPTFIAGKSPRLWCSYLLLNTAACPEASIASHTSAWSSSKEGSPGLPAATAYTRPPGPTKGRQVLWGTR